MIDVWSQPSAPINPTTEWGANYRVIAMDQRNAGGQSRANIAAVNASTGAVLPWNPGVAGNAVQALVARGDSLYIGGDYSQVGI